MKYTERKPAVLLLADGTQFRGKTTGLEGTSFGEICFNTGMTGYQEIFTDPSYFGQIMVTTNAHIGNYGVFSEEDQSKGIKIAGLVCKNFSYPHSRPAADDSLDAYLKAAERLTISDVDTRALVRYIRDNGAMNAAITTEVDQLDEIQNKLQEQPAMEGLELASKVSTQEPYLLGDEDAPLKVAVLDLGVKRNILNHITSRGIQVKVFPYDTPFETLQAWNPDGYFLSNGPGDPEPLAGPIAVAKAILAEKKPLFGICLGHQVIALANGIPTYKMFNGHRGINHPVLNLKTKKGEITSQNHGFAIDKAATEAHDTVAITHLHLNDDTVAGIEVVGHNCFSVQYHPEAAPGPNDATYLFDQFKELITNYKTN